MTALLREAALLMIGTDPRGMPHGHTYSRLRLDDYEDDETLAKYRSCDEKTRLENIRLGLSHVIGAIIIAPFAVVKHSK
jgi:hypothetical protein